jgi:cystathionine beta-synthase
VAEAIARMNENDFSQIPITQENRIVGSLNASHAYRCIIRDPAVTQQPVKEIMEPAFPYVDIDTPVELLAPMITAENPAVLVRDFKADCTYVITAYDVLKEF